MNPIVRAADAAASAVFGSLARVRSRGALHPDGVVCSGVLRITRTGDEPVGAELLDTPAEHAALCRFSRGVGLPRPLPDVLGVAVRLPDVHGPGQHQDLLLASSARAPLLRHVFRPTGSFSGPTFSTVQPYRLGDDLGVIGAEVSRQPGAARPRTLRDVGYAASHARLALTLGVASLSSGWRTVGMLELDRVLSVDESVGLTFTPSNTGAGLQPLPGSLTEVRRAAYRASQRRRPATAEGV